MKRKFNYYSLPPWVRKARAICAQFILPLCVFQGIRTLLIPTTFDVLLLAVFILLALAIQFDFI